MREKAMRSEIRSARPGAAMPRGPRPEAEAVFYEVFSPVYGYGRKPTIREAWRAAIEADGEDALSWGELFRVFGGDDPRTGKFVESRRESLSGVPAPAAKSGPRA